MKNAYYRTNNCNIKPNEVKAALMLADLLNNKEQKSTNTE